MKRLVLLLVAAVGAAVWWRSRSSDSNSSPEAWSSSEPAPEPPKLGGDVDPELLSILACPLDKQPVAREGDYLVCQECHRHYPIRDGIPVMLIDEALTPEQVAATQT